MIIIIPKKARRLLLNEQTFQEFGNILFGQFYKQDVPFNTNVLIHAKHPF